MKDISNLNDSKAIVCPNCGEVFSIDKSNYVTLLKQIETQEFESRLKNSIEKEIEITKVTAQKDYESKLNIKNQEIDKLKNIISQNDKDIEIAVSNAKNDFNNQILIKDKKISELQNTINNNSKDLELALEKEKHNYQKNIAEIEQTLTKLNEQLKNKDEQWQNINNRTKEQYEDKIQYLQDLLDREKQYKIELSTKGLGEDLEQYCSNEFEKIRPTAFKHASFTKDNDIKDGTKGDFIFRDYDINNIEFISIMFEMKNESDTTATKHKNEDFLKKLDKDRKQKACEYAVLVSTLEKDNDYYNDGIVDVSYRFGYEKMYVIRPQFFIPIITLLRNAAESNLANKQELELIKQQNVDVENFERKLEDFKTKIRKNYISAVNNHQNAIEKIDNTIKSLEKIKELLESSNKQMRFANNKAEELTIRKLTKDSPMLKESFNNLKLNDKTN